jgi:hypothetical protein
MLTKSQFSNCLLHTFGILLSIFVFHFTNIEASQKVLHINQGKIQKVKLYTDRAEIFRQIPLQIPVGSSDLIIGPFPASLTPDSLRISPGKSSSIRIGSFSIQKKIQNPIHRPFNSKSGGQGPAIPFKTEFY